MHVHTPMRRLAGTQKENFFKEKLRQKRARYGHSFDFFFFVCFLEVSDRLSSPKLSAQNSSSLSSLPLPPPAASESISHKNDDETNNLKEQQQSSSLINDASRTQTKLDENTTQPQPNTQKKKTNQQFTFSEDSRKRAQILLEELTKDIEDRSKHLYSHTSLPSNHDQHLSQRSSYDPYTDKLPPKSRRRSSALTKTSNQNDTITANDTS